LGRRLVLAPADVRFVSGLSVKAEQSAAADSRVQAVTEKWRTCMGGTGDRYRTPMETTAQDWPSPPPTAAEIAVAIADVRCKRQGRLGETWIAVLSAYQQRLIDQNRKRMDRVRAGLREQNRQANEVLKEYTR